MDHELKMRLGDLLCGVEPLEVLKALHAWCIDQAAIANAEGDKHSETEYLADADDIYRVVHEMNHRLKIRYSRIGLKSLI